MKKLTVAIGEVAGFCFSPKICHRPDCFGLLGVPCLSKQRRLAAGTVTSTGPVTAAGTATAAGTVISAGTVTAVTSTGTVTAGTVTDAVAASV